MRIETPSIDPVAAAVETLRPHGKRAVTGILRADTPLTDAVCDIVAGRQAEWDHGEWLAALTEIRREKLTVSEFIDLYT